jgi:hypothetical protein
MVDKQIDKKLEQPGFKNLLLYIFSDIMLRRRIHAPINQRGRRRKKNQPHAGAGRRAQGSHVRVGYETPRRRYLVKGNTMPVTPRTPRKPSYTPEEIKAAIDRYCSTKYYTLGTLGCSTCPYKYKVCYGQRTSYYDTSGIYTEHPTFVSGAIAGADVQMLIEKGHLPRR